MAAADDGVGPLEAGSGSRRGWGAEGREKKGDGKSGGMANRLVQGMGSSPHPLVKCQEGIVCLLERKPCQICAQSNSWGVGGEWDGAGLGESGSRT